MNRVLAAAAAALLLSVAAAVSVSAQEAIITGIDTDIANNNATTVGTIESCTAIDSGATFFVDVFIQHVPPFEGNPEDPISSRGGISGFSYNLLFDPEIVEVVDFDGEFLTTSIVGASGFGFIDGDGFAGTTTDPLPARTGNLRVDYGDLSTNYEDGDGVLSRLELVAKSSGQTSLRLVDLADQRSAPHIFDAATRSLPVDTVYNALVVVDGSCEAAPAPTPFTPRDGGAPGSIDELEDIPTPAPTVTSDGAGGPTPSADEANGGTTLPALAIDVMPSDNAPTTVGSIETCAAASAGDIFIVDVTIEDVQQLLAWDITVSYDPEVLSVQGREVRLFQEANDGSRVVDLSAQTPDMSGHYMVGAADTADPPSPDSGDGVLARLTMMAIADGTSPVSIAKIDVDEDGDFDRGVFLRDTDQRIIGDEDGDSLFDGDTADAEIRVGDACPDDPDVRVLLASEAKTPGLGDSAADDEDGDGATTILIIIGVVSAGLVAAGGAAFYRRRRRAG